MAQEIIMLKEYEHRYAKEERDLLRRLDKLFVEWQRQWDGDTRWFVWDGFYPGYLNASKKILFLGRDSYDIYNVYDSPIPHCSYILDFIPRYQNGCMDDGKSINQVKFHKLLLQVAYGLLHKSFPIEWQDVLDAKSICDTGRIFNEVSFSFMNLGKLSHESCEPCGVNADWGKIDLSVNFSTRGRNFIKEEVELLDPDLIIAMNLNENPLGRDYYKAAFGSNIVKLNLDIKDCCLYDVTLSDAKHVPLLDCWHFSSRKNEESYIYRPIVDVLHAIDFYK